MSASSFCSRQKNAEEMTAAALCPQAERVPLLGDPAHAVEPLDDLARPDRGVFRRLLVVRGGAPVEQGLGAERRPGDDEPGLQELPPGDRV